MSESHYPLTASALERTWETSGRERPAPPDFMLNLGTPPPGARIFASPTESPSSLEIALSISADATPAPSPYARLNHYRNLAPNWNGWGAEPPSDSVFDVVRTVMGQFSLAGVPVRDVTLGVDEVFYVKGERITADVYFDGSVVLVFHRDNEDAVILEVPAHRVAENLVRYEAAVA